MKLKIKYSSTKKFILNFNGSTLGELEEAVRAFVADNFGESWDGLALSLNGRDALEGVHDTTLHSLGVVASDMLSVVSGAGCSASPQDCGVSTKDSGASSTKDSGASSSKNSGTSARGDASSSKEAAAGGIPNAMAIQQQDCHSLLDVRDTAAAGDIMMVVPAPLTELLAHCRPSTASAAVNLLAHLTMLECGFCVQDVKDASTSTPPPSGWDGLLSTMVYTHRNYGNLTCTLVLVTMATSKQISLMFPKQDCKISTELEVTDYVTGDEDTEREGVTVSQLRNVSRLARQLRNELVIPVQLAAHRQLHGAVPSPYQLHGLPSELLQQLLKLCSVKSALVIAQTCRRLRDAVYADSLWKYYFLRDFGSPLPPAPCGEGQGWRGLYKLRHQQRRHARIGWDRDDTQPQPPHHPYPVGGPVPYPYAPPYQPVGPYPSVPDPSTPFNPYLDPDSPYYRGEVPNGPPYGAGVPDPLNPFGGGLPNPLNPYGGIPDPLNPYGNFPNPSNPFGGGLPDPLNPLGDPGFGGLGPALPRRPRGGPRGGPRFRYI